MAQMASTGPQKPHGFKLCLRNCFSCVHNCAVTSFIRSKENYQLTSSAAQVRSTLVIVLRANSSEFKSCGPPIPTHNHIALERSVPRHFEPRVGGEAVVSSLSLFDLLF